MWLGGGMVRLDLSAVLLLLLLLLFGSGSMIRLIV